MALKLFSHAEQVAEHLRGELLGGRWKNFMPGVLRLESELRVNRTTIDSALKLLENEGLLERRGAGKRRRIVLPEQGQRRSPLRARILLYAAEERGDPQISDLTHLLEEQGFRCHTARKSLLELGMDPQKVARLVKGTPADAWIVCAGSREVLAWFCEQEVPAIAFFGRFSGLPVAAASPRKIPALRKAVERLVELGHRRIVMLAREERLKPYPALMEQAFLDALKAHGIETGPFNLPVWGSRPEEFRLGLASLFKHTPPTALIISEPPLFVAARDQLAQRGLIAPRDISMICDDPDPVFAWCDPSVSHIRWDSRRVVRRVVRWVNNIAQGREDRRQALFEGEFVEGGTIGPAPPDRAKR